MDTNATPSAIERAIAACGSAVTLAGLIEVTPAAVGQWKSGERRVPAERCPLIERATGGVVRCEDLRPDVAWDVLRLQTGGQAEPVSAGVASEASTAGQA